MREIKFRGKTIMPYKEQEKWMYGYLTDSNLIKNENEQEAILVNQVTVGQYTGLKDKNGKEIYEGDIVRVEKIDFAYIYYDEDRMAWGIKPINEFCFDSPLLSENVGLELEVIGNVWEDGDLLNDSK